ncbi:Teichuronic acid biosynthesis protein TuaB [Gammaproteobacteria bacterium]|nr:oligosaccharide flippase family protein [Gammaproteobacteria bacterium]CAG0938059.1 Teichuronic acid biosynthesis protein TuaB [Gammaproteobacteria bacterium]
MQKRIFGYLSWQALSVLVQAVTQLGVTAVLARILAPADFGLVAAANIVVTFVQMVAEGGLGSAMVQRREISSAFVGAALLVSMLVGAACYLLLLVIALPFGALLDMEGLGPVILALGLSALLAGPSGVLEGLLQRNLKFDAIFRVSIVSSVLGYAIPAIAFAMAGAGVWAIVLGTLGRIGAKVAMMVIMQWGAWRLRWESALARELVHFGFGLTQDRFWLWLSAQAVPFLIGLFFGQELLGQFYMGNQLAVLPAQHISTVIAGVFFPIMSRSLADAGQASRQFMAVTSTVFVLLSALGWFLAINADLVVHLAFGEGWQQATVVFQVLCLGAGVRAAIQVCDSVNIARGDVYALARRRAMATVVLVAALLTTRFMGLAGATSAMLVGQVAMLAMTVGLAVRGLGIEGSDTRPHTRRILAATGLLILADLPGAALQVGGRVTGIPLLVVCIITNMFVMHWITRWFAVSLGVRLPWMTPADGKGA